MVHEKEGNDSSEVLFSLTLFFNYGLQSILFLLILGIEHSG